MQIVIQNIILLVTEALFGNAVSEIYAFPNRPPLYTLYISVIGSSSNYICPLGMFSL